MRVSLFALHSVFCVFYTFLFGPKYNDGKAKSGSKKTDREEEEEREGEERTEEVNNKRNTISQ